MSKQKSTTKSDVQSKIILIEPVCQEWRIGFNPLANANIPAKNLADLMVATINRIFDEISDHRARGNYETRI